MTEINKKLGIILLVIVVISTLVTTFAFYQLDNFEYKVQSQPKSADAEVSIRVAGSQVPISNEEKGEVSIQFRDA